MPLVFVRAYDLEAAARRGGAIVVFADEVDAYSEAVKGRGAEIALEPTDEPYGMRDFVVIDPDGNVLTFGCPLPEGIHDFI